MPGTYLKRAAITFLLTFTLGVAALQFDLIGRAAYAVDWAVVAVTDQELPTPAEMSELARVNRLVVRKSLPAVVHIVTMTAARPTRTPRSEEEYPDFLRQRPGWDQLTEEQKREWWRRLRLNRPSRSQGSGVVIDAEKGIILTNHHVVGEVDEIEVRLPDGRRIEARLIGKDRPTDLAVIRIDADRLFELPIGDSDALQVGDPVMTIGNPFGYEGSVSKGIVSALGRSQVGLIDYEGFVQTDAVINPGNSGGPLVNMRAEIVGISTAIESTTGSFNGIGLAIPSSRIKQVLPALLEGRQVVRGFLGVYMPRGRQSLDPEKDLGWSELYGVVVDAISPDSPAQEAGLRAADILVNMNGQPLQSSTQLTDKVAFISPGDTLVFDVWRNRRMVSVQVVVGRQPTGFSTRGDRFMEAPTLVEHNTDLSALGLDVQALDEELARTYRLRHVAARGVVVTHVAPHSAASSQSVEPGDLIVAVNGNVVTTPDEMDEALKYIGKNEPIDLRLRNRKGSRHVQLEPGEVD